MPKVALSPRVYIACLACYNAGKHEGEWFDAIEGLCQEHETWHEAHVKAIGENHEEYLVHDYEGFGSFKMGEVSPQEAEKIGAFIEEHGIPGALALDNCGGDVDDAAVCMESYQGAHDSLADWAESWAQDCYDLKGMGNLANYIDWERYAEDCRMGGDIWYEEGEDGMVHVFDNH